MDIVNRLADLSLTAKQVKAQVNSRADEMLAWSRESLSKPIAPSKWSVALRVELNVILHGRRFGQTVKKKQLVDAAVSRVMRIYKRFYARKMKALQRENKRMSMWPSRGARLAETFKKRK
jgi:hypothetical protein